MLLHFHENVTKVLNVIQGVLNLHFGRGVGPKGQKWELLEQSVTNMEACLTFFVFVFVLFCFVSFYWQNFCFQKWFYSKCGIWTEFWLILGLGAKKNQRGNWWFLNFFERGKGVKLYVLLNLNLERVSCGVAKGVWKGGSPSTHFKYPFPNPLLPNSSIAYLWRGGTTGNKSRVDKQRALTPIVQNEKIGFKSYIKK